MVLSLYRILAVILVADAVFTVAAARMCDNFITPKETALGAAVVALFVWGTGRAVLSGRWSVPRLTAPLVFLFLWVAATFAASMLGPHPVYSLGQMKLMFVYAALGLAAASAGRQSRREEKMFFVVLSVAALLFSAHGIMQYFGLDFLEIQSRYALSEKQRIHVYSLFGNSALLSEFLAVAAAGLVFAATESRLAAPVRWLAGTGAAAAIVCILLAASRTALVALFCAAAFIVMYRTLRSRDSRRIAGAVIIIVVAGAAAGAAVYMYSDTTKSKAVQLRMIYWRYALDMYGDAPAAGSGAGHFKLDYIDKQKEYFSSPRSVDEKIAVLYEKPRHPHNEYLNALVESGPAGLFFFAMIFVSGMAVSLRVDRGAASGAGGAMLAAFAAAGAFSMPLSVPVTGMFIGLLAGVVGAETAGDEERQRGREAPVWLKSPYARALAVAVIAAAGAALIAEQFDALEARIYLTKAKRAQPNLERENAEEYARKALEIYPEMGEAHFMLGVTALRLGRAEEALEHFEKAEETSSDLNLIINRSLALAAAGRIYDAIDVMKEAASISPRDMRPRKMLVRYYSQLGYYADALEIMEEVLKYEGRIEENLKAYRQLEQLAGGSPGRKEEQE